MLTSNWLDYLLQLPRSEAGILTAVALTFITLIAAILAGVIWGWG